jgi:hypothetical protein
MLLMVLGLAISSSSFATQAKENCDALAESSTRTNPKKDLASGSSTVKSSSGVVRQ